MRTLLILIITIILATAGHAQITVNSQNAANLAHSYYRNNEFDKAAPMFLDLYEKTKSTHYFDYYINCLVSMAKYDEAEKELKKIIRTDKNPIHQISLGYIYKSKNDIAGAQKVYNEVITNLQPNMGSIITVANTFFNRSEFALAEKTYIKGRQLINGEMFHNYLATVYAYQRNYDKMMQEYMALLAVDENNLNNVQGRLNSLMRFDFDNTLRNIVKREVLRSIQSSPNTLVYNRLLIWIFVQEENFEQALNQSVALDRRTRNEETSIITFARSAAEKSLYDVAISALTHLTTRTPAPVNLADVKTEKIRIEYLRLINNPKAKEIDFSNMEILFAAFFEEFGYNNRTAALARNYAHFMAFYRNKTEEAFTILETAMKSREMDANNFTQLRIEMADLNVFAGYLWEASLQYSQIIELNKNNPIGDDVKLKRAQLSYFLGEIEWAKAQLDILKAGTSNLTANDAMDLSLLITANYELDTIVEPVQMFARADLHMFRHQYDKALQVLDSLKSKYPGHTLLDQILMRKAMISEQKFKYTEATQYYSQLILDYPFSTVADKALFTMAKITESKLNDPEKAKEYYKQILLSYPGSIYVADARDKFREIRGDFMPADPFDMLDATARPGAVE
jgi:tetratricopeptide (TPR) repeat protein